MWTFNSIFLIEKRSVLNNTAVRHFKVDIHKIRMRTKTFFFVNRRGEEQKMAMDIRTGKVKLRLEFNGFLIIRFTFENVSTGIHSKGIKRFPYIIVLLYASNNFSHSVIFRSIYTPDRVFRLLGDRRCNQDTIPT